MTFWNSVQSKIRETSDAAILVPGKALDRQVIALKKKFGIDMYDHINTYSYSEEFYASDDDELVNKLRPSFIIAQREIKALTNGARANLQLQMSDIKGQVQRNKSKSSLSVKPAMTEVKLKTGLMAVESKIMAIKEEFGLDLYDKLVAYGIMHSDEHSDDDDDRDEYDDHIISWSPSTTDQQFTIECIYAQTRRDVEMLLKKKESIKYKHERKIKLSQRELRNKWSEIDW